MKKTIKKILVKKPAKKVIKKEQGPIESVAQAFKYLGIKPNLPEVSMLPERDRASIIAYYKLTKIIEAENKRNNNWLPNWNDSNQVKYYPYFRVAADDKRPSGFGFSYSDYVLWAAHTHVGSRLCVGDSSTAIRLGKKFAKLYAAWMLFLD